MIALCSSQNIRITLTPCRTCTVCSSTRLTLRNQYVVMEYKLGLTAYIRLDSLAHALNRRLSSQLPSQYSSQNLLSVELYRRLFGFFCTDVISSLLAAVAFLCFPTYYVRRRPCVTAHTYKTDSNIVHGTVVVRRRCRLLRSQTGTSC